MVNRLKSQGFKRTSTLPELSDDEFLSRRFVTKEELAARWRMTPAALDTWRWQQKGPRYLKMAGHIRYPVQAVLDFERDSMIWTGEPAEQQKGPSDE